MLLNRISGVLRRLITVTGAVLYVPLNKSATPRRMAYSRLTLVATER